MRKSSWLFTEYETDSKEERSFRVEYDYQPAEPMQPNPDLDGFGPGCAEEFTVTNVRAALNGELVNITSHIPEDHIDVLADLCAEDYHSE